jgi:hypothetical protein
VQNLAILDDLYDGDDDFKLSALGIDPDTPQEKIELAGILIGTAADKTLDITRDQIVALNVIMDLGLTDPEIDQIYEKASAVQDAVVAAHG